MRLRRSPRPVAADSPGEAVGPWSPQTGFGPVARLRYLLGLPSDPGTRSDRRPQDRRPDTEDPIPKTAIPKTAIPKNLNRRSQTRSQTSSQEQHADDQPAGPQGPQEAHQEEQVSRARELPAEARRLSIREDAETMWIEAEHPAKPPGEACPDGMGTYTIVIIPFSGDMKTTRFQIGGE